MVIAFSMAKMHILLTRFTRPISHKEYKAKFIEEAFVYHFSTTITEFCNYKIQMIL